MTGHSMDRFWAKVDVSHPLGCWEWTGAVSDLGYGRCNEHVHGTGYAHRAAYEALIGAIPDGKTLDHLCRNRRCVNPDHLEPVTQGENVLRGYSPAGANARKTTCLRGHALPPDRICRTCAGDQIRKLQRRGAGHLPASAHGKPSTYNNYGCRCEPCRRAASEARRRRKTRAAAKADGVADG